MNFLMHAMSGRRTTLECVAYGSHAMRSTCIEFYCTLLRWKEGGRGGGVVRPSLCAPIARPCPLPHATALALPHRRRCVRVHRLPPLAGGSNDGDGLGGYRQNLDIYVEVKL